MIAPLSLRLRFMSITPPENIANRR